MYMTILPTTYNIGGIQDKSNEGLEGQNLEITRRIKKYMWNEISISSYFGSSDTRHCFSIYGDA